MLISAGLLPETKKPERAELLQNGDLPCMSTYPLVNYGHSSIFKELQVFYWGLEPHHFWQQPLQLFKF